MAFGLYQVVFGNPGTPLSHRIARFCLVDAVGLAIALAVSSLFARVLLPAIGWTFHPFDFAHLAGVAAPTAAELLATISEEDLDLIHWADTPDEAYAILRGELEKHHINYQTTGEKEPEIAKTRRR